MRSKVSDVNSLWTRSYRSERPARDAYLTSNHPCWTHLTHSLAGRRSSSPTGSGPSRTRTHTPLTLEPREIRVRLSGAAELQLISMISISLPFSKLCSEDRLRTILRTQFSQNIYISKYCHLLTGRVYFLYEKI